MAEFILTYMHRDELRLALFGVILNDLRKVYAFRATLAFTFPKAVTKYSVMSVMKERVLFIWWALVSAHG